MFYIFIYIQEDKTDIFKFKTKLHYKTQNTQIYYKQEHSVSSISLCLYHFIQAATMKDLFWVILTALMRSLNKDYR